MGKGSKKKSSRTSSSQLAKLRGNNGMYGGMGGMYGGWSRPSRSRAAPKTNYQAKYNASQKNAASARARANKQSAAQAKKYNDLNRKHNQRLAEDNANPNRNLKAATIKGNESNTRSITSFNSMAENLTNNFNRGTSDATRRNMAQNQQTTNRYQNDLRNNLGQQDREAQAATQKREQGMNNAYSDFSTKNDALASKYDQEKRGSFTGYDERMRNSMDNMGKADQDIHTRNKGAAYAGLDSGFADAGDELQASLARRGMSSAGVGAKSMKDLAQDRMRAGAAAGVGAYTSAIDQSDNRRMQNMSAETQLYGSQNSMLDNTYGANTAANQAGYGARTGTIEGNYGANLGRINDRFANQNNLSGSIFNTEQGVNNDAYQKNMSMLGQNYGNTMAVRGQALQNTLNNNQQRIGNLMGYAQLGNKMAGMSQNYLQQAGSGYTAIGGQAGQTAIGVGQLNNSYNATMQSAITANKDRTANMWGTALGVGGKVAMGSDINLKENLTPLMEISEGITLYEWDWNEEANKLGLIGSSKGVIAQEVEKVLPEAVTINIDNGYLQVNYNIVFGGV